MREPPSAVTQCDQNQLFAVVAGVEDALDEPVVPEPEFPFELEAGAELSEGFDASPPDDLAASPLLAAAGGFAEE